MLSAVLQYASASLPVFPTHWITPSGACSCQRECSSPGKHPLTRHGLKDATTAPAVIWRWWQQYPQANIGVATGSVYVIDLDGTTGMARWDALTLKHGDVATRTARTGGGGRHLYYRTPHGEVLPNTAGKLGRNVDTRGHGGYVLAPPSNHKSGEAYAWINDEPIADLPVWVIETLRPKLPKQPAAEPTLTNGTAYGQGVMNGALRRIREAPEGERNQRLNYEAFLVAQYIAGGEIAIGDAFEALVGASPDPDRKKSEDTVKRALNDGAQYPRRKADDD